MSGRVAVWPAPVLGWVSPSPNDAAIAVALAHNAFQVAVTYTSSSGKVVQIVWNAQDCPPAFATSTHVVLSGEFAVEIYRRTGCSRRLTWVVLVCIIAHELTHIEFNDGANADHPWVREIRADFYSGRIAKLVGVTMEEVWRYANFLHYVQGAGTQTHPPGGHRLNAVMQGYNYN